MGVLELSNFSISKHTLLGDSVSSFHAEVQFLPGLGRGSAGRGLEGAGGIALGRLSGPGV